MASRLDRLFILLDTGSNESIRVAAAKQLGEVQRVQPNDTNYLLHKIKEYSTKSSWDTRIAAGNATKYVLENVDSWPPNSDKLEHIDNKDYTSKYIKLKEIFYQLDIVDIITKFDLTKITASCSSLLCIEQNEREFNEQQSSSSTNINNSRTIGGRQQSTSSRRSKKIHEDQLNRQRSLINKELGIAMVDRLDLGVKSTDIVTNDDLLNDTDNASQLEANYQNKSSDRKDIKIIINKIICNYERISKSIDEIYNIKSTPIRVSEEGETTQRKTKQQVDPSRWPLDEITNDYIDDMFSPSWEVRHGAAIALREIIRLQGKCAGKRVNLPDDINEKLNQLWLVEMALRGIVILALDKFSDFLFDQVVAPVRENAAQMISCCIANLNETLAFYVMRLFKPMLESSEWEIRYGGILALKYSINVVDKSLGMKILKEFFDMIFKCLNDHMDDVAAEAAVTLLPVKDLLLMTVPEKGPELIRFLWNLLSQLDELTSSTGNIILLLASLISTSSAELTQDELIKSIPKLWTLMSHPSTSVRKSVFKALKSLMDSIKSSCLIWMPEELSITAFRLVYQRAILENSPELRPIIEDIWLKLVCMSSENEHLERINLLKATSQHLNYWLCLAQQPLTVPIDRGNPLWLNLESDGRIRSNKPVGEVYIGSYNFNSEDNQQQKLEIVKCRRLASRLVGILYASITNEMGTGPEYQHVRDAENYLCEMFVHHLMSKSANQRMISAWTLESWASYLRQLRKYDCVTNHEDLNQLLPKNLKQQIHLALKEKSLCYDELASNYTCLQQIARDFVASLRLADADIDLASILDKATIYDLTQIKKLGQLMMNDEIFKRHKRSETNPYCYMTSELLEILGSLIEKQRNLLTQFESSSDSQRNLSISVLSSLACAVISWGAIRSIDFDLLVQPLMDAVAFEENQVIRDMSIKYLMSFMDCLFHDGVESERDYIEKNIIEKLLHWVTSHIKDKFISDDQVHATKGQQCNTIMLLDDLQRLAEMKSMRRQSSVSIAPSIMGSLKRTHSFSASESVTSSLINSLDERRTGAAKAALVTICSHMSESLDDKLHSIWKVIMNDLPSYIEIYNSQNNTYPYDQDNMISLITSLHILIVIGETLQPRFRHQLMKMWPGLIRLLESRSHFLRNKVAECCGKLTQLMFNESIGYVRDLIIPLLDDQRIEARCGAIEAIAQIIEHLQSIDLVGQVNFFIITILKRMSDQHEPVRLLATHCFGRLLTLMPLNRELNSKEQLQQETLDKNDQQATTITSHKRAIGQATSSSIDHKDRLDDSKQAREEFAAKCKGDGERREEECSFIDQLLNPKYLKSFQLPFEMKVELRSYQQDGLNWLAFLNEYNLNGILCDEMGLGKTLMTICIIASHHLKQHQQQEQQQQSSTNRAVRPSLIICPTTLIEHWIHEIWRFLPTEIQNILHPVRYYGNDTRYETIRPLVDRRYQDIEEVPQLVVTSYDIVRNRVEALAGIQWNYCVLDEGHMIKNGKSKLSRSISRLRADHRLILSGTPIQNNVTELWSLFDFLMPGLLGSERLFNTRFSRPILQSRELKCSSKEQEAGALAMEALHRQVLPFILRRLKQDVLQDLPPKIIQDYYCELSPLQERLYEDFKDSRTCKRVIQESDILANHWTYPHLHQHQKDEENKKRKSHIFQSLQYLKNVCNHPKMVLTEQHPKFTELTRELDNQKSSLDDITHSSKLKALNELLIDCGIGVIENQSREADSQSVNVTLNNSTIVTQHRALIFCQVRSMVSIIENDLLKKHHPNITYLRLDGSVPPNARFEIVSRFNDDPSIDVLLLTTSIGGLGLNLTGADTVIFVEHDWNPTKDLQAMDRAHRIGQKKIVNVYRLITRGTLEEKIMGLQKFKTMVSNTVINQDNSDLSTMGIQRLFDLFMVTTIETHENKDLIAIYNSKQAKKKSFLDLFPELWDQQQYETEYDLSSFLATLKHNR